MPARYARPCSLFALFLALVIGAAPAATAQVVEAEPALPTADGGVTIFFNADEGTGGLEGYDGDVYAHTGLVTSESRDGNDWRYVQTDWPNNIPKIKLERVSENRYKLEIDNIRDFYSEYQATPPADVPTPWDDLSDETIEQIALVFRNADGSLQGKSTEGNGNIYINVAAASDGDPSVQFAEPQVMPFSPVFARQDTTFSVVVEAANQAQIRLLVDGEEVAATADAALTYSLTLSGAGRTDVVAIAEGDGAEADTTSFYAIRVGEEPVRPRPAGVVDGINYDDDPTEVTLSLYAPYKEFVYVMGDFSDWEVEPQYQMTPARINEDSVHYWITLTDLEPGQEYGFQYFVDGEIRVGDPYAEKVLSPNDQFIASETYPNLKPYPAGRTDQLVTVFETGQQEFSWTDDEYEAPAQKDLVIYELLIRDFLEAHDYEALADTLDYLERLGVTAIELMPVAEFDNNESWGYNPAYYFAPDKYYGPEEDLKAFINMAHERGLAVILDVVYNHATGQSPFVRLYNEGEFGPPTEENPWVNPTARHPFNVFYDNDHASAATKYWLDRVNRHWIEEYHVDGYRFDLSKGFTQGPPPNGYEDVGAWSSFDQERVDILTRMADQIWAVDDDAYIILEHFAESQEEEVLTTYATDRGLPGMMVWNNMNRAYSQSAMGYLSDEGFSSDLARTYPPNIGVPVAGAVTYMESHDEQWLMFRNIASGPEEGGYDVTSFPTALNRQKLVGAFFFTVPGPRMLWQFGELGYGWGDAGEQCLKDGGGGEGECASAEVPVDQIPGRTAPKPIRWDYLDDENRADLYKTWAALINLRNANGVFTSPETEVTLDVDQGDASRSITLVNGDVEALIVGNFGLEAMDVEVSFPSGGTWYDFFPGEPLEITSTDTAFAYAPGEFHVYMNTVVAFPEEGIVPFGSTRPAGSAGPPASVTASISQTFGDVSDAQNYKLVALPGDPDDAQVGDYVSGEPGVSADWRAFWDDGSDEDFLIPFDASNEVFDYAPGRGYWMLSRAPRMVDETFDAVDVGEDGTYAIDLHDGWNIISNPFDRDVSWAEVEAANESDLQPIWAWNGSFSESATFATAKEGIGYYFFNDGGLDELALPYPGAGSASSVRVAQRQAAGPSLTLTAYAGGQRASALRAGLAEGASEGRDAHDVYAPPARFEAASLRLAADGESRTALAADLRPASAEGHAFALALTAEEAQTVTLRADGLGSLGESAAWLVVEETGEAYDLRTTPAVEVEAGAEPVALTLLIGSEAFVAGRIERLPQSFSLQPSYPNPFQSKAAIEYALPEAAKVKLDVYDVLGRKVATLVDREQPAGRHRATLRASGLAPGVYVYRLRAGDFEGTGRMVLVK